MPIKGGCDGPSAQARRNPAGKRRPQAIPLKDGQAAVMTWPWRYSPAAAIADAGPRYDRTTPTMYSNSASASVAPSRRKTSIPTHAAEVALSEWMVSLAQWHLARSGGAGVQLELARSDDTMLPTDPLMPFGRCAVFSFGLIQAKLFRGCARLCPNHRLILVLRLSTPTSRALQRPSPYRRATMRFPASSLPHGAQDFIHMTLQALPSARHGLVFACG